MLLADIDARTRLRGRKRLEIEVGEVGQGGGLNHQHPAVLVVKEHRGNVAKFFGGHGPRAGLGPFHPPPEAVVTAAFKFLDPAGGRSRFAVFGRMLGLVVVVQRDVRIAEIFPRGGYDGFRIIHTVRPPAVPAGKRAGRQKLNPLRRGGRFRRGRGQFR